MKKYFWDRDDVTFFVIMMMFAVIVGAIVLSVGMNSRYRAKLMAECLADGHAEYECHGIIRGRR